MRKAYLPALIMLLLIHILTNAGHLSAQQITGLEIIPENPGSSDDINMVIHTAFAFSPCHLDSVHPYYACGAFSFNAFYNSGFDSDSCERSDTIHLGMLSNGMYVISYRMYYLGWSQVDQVDTFIMVGPTGMEHHLMGDGSGIKVWPNPSHGSVNILAAGLDADRIRILELSGKVVGEYKIDHHANIYQNEVSLQAGTYLCTALKNNRIAGVARFIVLE